MTVPGPDIADACVVFLATFGLGSAIFGCGLAIRLGYYKRYFLVRGPAPFLGPANYHVTILAGALGLVLGIAMVPPDPETGQKLLDYLLIPSLVLFVIISLWQPWWLKPKWIRQL